MTFRDVVLTCLIMGLLPFCLSRPWIGVLTWSWLGYMNPHRMTWGFAYDLPFGMMVMLATIVGLVITKDKKGLPNAIEVYLLLALWGWFLVTTLFAFYPEDAWIQFNKVSKILVGIFLSLFLLQDARKLRALIWVIALSIGFFGVKGGIFSIMTGAQNQVLGPRDSFISGNTEIGLALNMVIPLLVFLQREETKLWRRRLLMASVILSIIASLGTYSRGALIGLAVVVPLVFLKSRARLILLPLLALAIFILPSVMPTRWLERMGTIETYDQDVSANQRLNSWYVARELAKDYPVMGGGFRTFSRDIYETYMPGYKYAENALDAHSIYFQVLGEHGFTGLALFVALIASTLLSLRRIIWKTRREPSQQWICNCAQMLEVSVLAYAVSGAFLSMSYFDLFYHQVVITVILKTLVKAPLPAPEISATVAPSGGQALAKA
ncbi:MAG TPA: putative O-glycosylation ligase, exosortase A system-associated [Methylomirabilota bacterium]